jgi:16S rRNA (cytosine1402-N4)-methyltransferase
MRFDPTEDTPTAADLLRDLPEHELARLFRELGDEPFPGRIARAIAERRRVDPPMTHTAELAALVARARPRAPRGVHLHPATQVFQALRIAVNRELDGLAAFVAEAVHALAPGGRLVGIAFHGGEDRILKNALRDLAGRCTCPPELPQCRCGRVSLVDVLTKKPLRPTEAEVSRNPRARSARLRAAERRAA